MGQAEARFHLTEARRARATIVSDLFGTQRFSASDNPINTTAAFVVRATPITVALSVTRDAAGSNGLLFDFGGTTTGLAAWLDTATLGFAAGDATGTAGGAITIANALPATDQVFDLVFSVVPGFGIMRVWIDGALKGRLETASMSAYAGTGDGAIGTAGAGDTSARVPAPQAVTLANASLVGPVRFYDKQRPRNLAFLRGKSTVVPQASLLLTGYVPTATIV